MMQMIFSMNMVNTKVVANFLIMLVLKFHDHGPDSFGVMLLASSLSALLMLCIDLNDGFG
jgi:hypothetical protein